MAINVTSQDAIAARNSATMIGNLNAGLTTEIIFICAFLGLVFRSLMVVVVSVLPIVFPVFAAGALLGAACGGRSAPERGDLDPAAIRTVLGDVFLLEIGGKDRHVVRLAGTRICALLGRELRGRPFAEPFAPEDWPGLYRLLDDVTDTTVPVVCGIVGETDTVRADAGAASGCSEADGVEVSAASSRPPRVITPAAATRTASAASAPNRRGRIVLLVEGQIVDAALDSGGVTFFAIAPGDVVAARE
jgi:hypothetical protein